MARLRRVTALVMAFLLTQLLLVGSGYACTVMGSMAEHGRRSPTDVVAAADTPAVATATSTGEGCADVMPPAPAPAGSHGPDSPPCPLPWAPSGCRGVPCAPASIPTAAQAILDAPPTAADRPSLAVLPPVSVVRAPELPPPRA